MPPLFFFLCKMDGSDECIQQNQMPPSPAPQCSTMIWKELTSDSGISCSVVRKTGFVHPNFLISFVSWLIVASCDKSLITYQPSSTRISKRADVLSIEELVYLQILYLHESWHQACWSEGRWGQNAAHWWHRCGSAIRVPRGSLSSRLPSDRYSYSREPCHEHTPIGLIMFRCWTQFKASI